MKTQAIFILGAVATLLIGISIYYLYVNRAGEDTASLMGKLLTGIITTVVLTFIGLLKDIKPLDKEVNVKVFVSENTGDIAPFGNYREFDNGKDIFACINHLTSAHNQNKTKLTLNDNQDKDDLVELLFLIWYIESYPIKWDGKTKTIDIAAGPKVSTIGREKGYKFKELALEEYDERLSKKYPLKNPSFSTLVLPPNTKVTRQENADGRVIKIETDRVFLQPRLVITINLRREFESNLLVNRPKNPNNKMMLLLPLLTKTKLADWKEWNYSCKIEINRNRFALNSPEMKKQFDWALSIHENFNNSFGWSSIKDNLIEKAEEFYAKNIVSLNETKVIKETSFRIAPDGKVIRRVKVGEKAYFQEKGKYWTNVKIDNQDGFVKTACIE